MLVGKDWKVESDRLNVIVSRRKIVRKGKNAGQETWIAEAYFSSLQHALNFLVDEEVKETGLKDIKLVLQKQEELYALIRGYILDWDGQYSKLQVLS